MMNHRAKFQLSASCGSRATVCIKLPLFDHIWASTPKPRDPPLPKVARHHLPQGSPVYQISAS